MQEKYKQLLEALLESSKEFLNSQELGELAGISQRTVIRLSLIHILLSRRHLKEDFQTDPVF